MLFVMSKALRMRAKSRANHEDCCFALCSPSKRAATLTIAATASDVKKINKNAKRVGKNLPRHVPHTNMKISHSTFTGGENWRKLH